MGDSLLVVDAAFGAANAVVFASVGWLNLRRAPSEPRDARRAIFQFATWWLALSAMTLLTALRSLAVALGDGTLATHVALQVAGYAPLCLALWGLLSYLVYIYRGSHRAQPLLAGYHSALFIGLVGLLVWSRPLRITSPTWTGIVGERSVTGALLLIVLALILGPILGGAVAYAALAFRTDEPAARKRIFLVSFALIGWILASGATNATSLAAQAWWPVAARIIALAATLVLLYAYGKTARPLS